MIFRVLDFENQFGYQYQEMDPGFWGVKHDFWTFQEILEIIFWIPGSAFRKSYFSIFSKAIDFDNNFESEKMSSEFSALMYVFWTFQKIVKHPFLYHQTFLCRRKIFFWLAFFQKLLTSMIFSSL